MGPIAYRTSNDTVSAYSALDIVKSDVTVFPVTRALYIGGAGNLTVKMASGQTVTFNNVPVGIFPIQVIQVLDATTATSIVALS